MVPDSTSRTQAAFATVLERHTNLELEPAELYDGSVHHKASTGCYCLQRCKQFGAMRAHIALFHACYRICDSQCQQGHIVARDDAQDIVVICPRLEASACAHNVERSMHLSRL